jgi:thiol-disulfide isomerase/thioredoxin
MKLIPILLFASAFSAQAQGRDPRIVEIPYEQPRPIPDPMPIGTEVGSIIGRDINGKRLKRLSFDDDKKLYLVDFWFMRCKPCLAAIPKLVELNAKYQQAGLVVVGLNSFDTKITKPGDADYNTINQPKEKVSALIDQLRINYALYFTKLSVDQEFQVSSYPTLYLIQNGKIILAHAGYSKDEMIMLERKIQEIVEH